MKAQIGINTEGLKLVGSYIGTCEQWEHVYSLNGIHYIDRVGMGGMITLIKTETALQRIEEARESMAKRTALIRAKTP